MIDAQHIAARVQALTLRLPAFTGLLVAFSGGRDSSVLLSLMARADVAPVRAVNVDHGLQPDIATQWLAHNAQFCEGLGVPFTRVSVDVAAHGGESLEAAARRARYAALAGEARTGELVLLAQHESDQAETLLLQLLRGGGPDGLASMPTVSVLGETLMARPLLDVTDADIAAYAHDQRLRWFEDPSNQDQRFDRNFLRAVVMPSLRERWPSVDRTLSRGAQWQAEAAQLQHQLGAADMRTVTIDGRVLSCGRLARLTSSRLSNTLRFAIRAAGLTTPSAQRLAALQTLALQTAGRGSVRWHGGVALRYRDQLHLLDELSPDPVSGWSAALPTDHRLQLPHTFGTLALAAERAHATLTVRFREGGERVPLAGGQHQALAKWFQQHGIPPWQRSRMPLVFAGDTLIAIGEHRLSRWSEFVPGGALIWRR
ncbi:MAG: tRNA lysidine(34) synthetase TilS [Pseudomonadota bacterium]